MNADAAAATASNRYRGQRCGERHSIGSQEGKIDRERGSAAECNAYTRALEDFDRSRRGSSTARRTAESKATRREEKSYREMPLGTRHPPVLGK